MKKQEMEDKLLELTRQLTSRMIPYNPPLSGDSLERMKRMNPEGYKLLMEYLDLEEKLEQTKVTSLETYKKIK